MKKIWSIFLSILLGAFVVGLGTGYFLYLANKDRQALAYQAKQAKQEAQDAYEESQKAIEIANSKVTQASAEVIKAQNALKALEQERELLNQAKHLSKPNAQETVNWQTIVSPSLGISLQLPPLATIIENDERALISTDGRDDQDGKNSPWLAYQPYSSSAEKELKTKLSSSTAVTYFVGGKLLTGERGVVADADEPKSASLLQVFSHGTTTHLLWIQNPPEQKRSWRSLPTITQEDILATIDFQ